MSQTDMERARELLACPFCGAPMQLRYALWVSEGDTDAVIHNVPGGTDCPIEGAFSIGTADNGVSVAEAWNRRTPDAALSQVRAEERAALQPAEPVATTAAELRSTPPDRLQEAVIVGWNACRKSVYAVCEDIQDRAEASLESQHEHGFYRGEKSAAKSIARGFGAMNATDDNHVLDALAAIRQRSTP